MTDAIKLSMTLGPVQGFVASSRRTRDLWGSSYLLSWLAGHAITAALEHGAQIEIPDVSDDPLVAHLSGSGGQKLLSHGSLPIRVELRTAPALRALKKPWNLE